MPTTLFLVVSIIKIKKINLKTNRKNIPVIVETKQELAFTKNGTKKFPLS